MSCRKSLEIEFSEFLADPRAAGFAAFRAHYPRCAECAAEVRAWTELHGRLAAAHPDPEQLAGYENLLPEERAALDRHLARCPSCREELAGLAAFDPQRLLLAAALPAERKSGPGLREALAWLGRLLWHPAFAYAMAGLLLFPLLYRSLDTSLQAPGGPSPLREEVRSVARAVAPPPSARPRAPGRRAEARVAKSVPAAPLEGDQEVPVSAEPRLEAFAQREAEPRFEDSAGALRLEAQRRVEIDLPIDRDLELRVPIPAGTPAGQEVEVRVVSSRGRRELRERVAAPAALPAQAGAREVSVHIPRGWLGVGVYRIELQLPAGASDAERPIRFSLVVNPPQR